MRRALAVLLVAVCVAPLVAVAEEAVDLATVLRKVLAAHPELDVARIDSAIADTASAQLAGMLDTRATAKAGIAQNQTPVNSSFQPIETRTAQLTAGLTKPLATGDTVGVALDYNRSKQLFNSPFISQLAAINPSYQSQLNISIRHPLAQGKGLPAYHQGLRAAKARQHASRWQQRIIAHQLALQALNLFYQLALDDINLHFARLAVQRAERLLAYQRKREAFGLVEESDRLQAAALLAQRRTQLAEAEARRANDQSALNRLMLRDPDAPLRVRLPEDPPASHIPSLAQAVDNARAHRAELKAIEEQLQAAEAELEIARDKLRAQLDLVAELGTRALSGSAGTTLARTFSINDHYAALSLEFSDAIEGRAERAAVRAAELKRERALAERRKALESIRDELARAATQIRTLAPTLRLARVHAAAERRKFAQEMTRYRQGRSDTAKLIQFEGDLHNAELLAELKHVQWLLACQQYRWAQGMLLAALNVPTANGS